MIDESYLYDFLSVWDMMAIYRETKDKVKAYENMKFNEIVEFLEGALRDILRDRHYDNTKGRKEKAGFESQVSKAKEEGWKLTDDEIYYLQGVERVNTRV